MKCLNPIKLNNDLSVPCGRCIHCLETRTREWQQRLYFHCKESIYNVFVTLTYSDNNLPRNYFNRGVVSVSDVQKFIKRLRFLLLKHYNQNFKYFGCSEYGPNTGRPHYHLMFMFGNSLNIDYHNLG